MNTCPRCNGTFPEDVGTCPHDGEPLVGASEEDLPPGFMVGEYRVEKKLGEGGFGAVYRAVHHLIHKAVAIKVLNRVASADPSMVSRFTSEARVVNQIRHRHIVDIFAFGKLPDGRHYHVMELLDGVPLDEHLDARGRLSFEEAHPILRGVARALSAAHAAGVVHRDLKPANVFLVRDEDTGFVPKLIDFGIAKLSDDQSAHKTKTGAMMGTAYYMSPEQCRGKGVDARTDIYAFGVMVHVTLTGQKLFDGESVMDVVMKQITEAPGRMSSVCPAVPAALDEPVLRMLEKDPARRPQTILEALSGLEAAASAISAEGASSGRASGIDATIVDADPRGSLPAEPAALSANTDSVASISQSVSQPGVTGSSLVEGRGAGSPRGRNAAIVVACLAAAGVGFGGMLSMFRGSSGAHSAPPGQGSTMLSPGADSPPLDATGNRPSVTPVGAAPTAAPADSSAPAPSATATAAPGTAPSGKASSPAATATAVAKPTATAATGAPAAPPPATTPKKPPARPQDELDF